MSPILLIAKSQQHSTKCVQKFCDWADSTLTLFDGYGTFSSALIAVPTAVTKSRKARANAPNPPVRSAKLKPGLARVFAEWFEALADPTRIRILNLLACNHEAVCVRDMVKHFAVGQPTISHHLRILRKVRFVHAERRGTFMYYAVNRKCLAEFPNAARMILDV